MNVGTPKGSQLFSCHYNKLTKVTGAAKSSKLAEKIRWQSAHIHK